MTMAHSIEARPPLLDHKLVEFAATIPARSACGRHDQVPAEASDARDPARPIIDRPKHGFAVPLAHWFRGSLAGFARDLLLAGSARQRGFFNARYIESLLQQNDRGRDLDLQLWTILSFELWCQRFLDPPTPNTFAAGDVNRGRRRPPVTAPPSPRQTLLSPMQELA
jgi:asparagine synthase (glutamine-hydrolysing)